MNRRLWEEIYQVAFLKKVYRSIDKLKLDLDECVSQYNGKRPHTGKYFYGKTPMQKFRDTIHLPEGKNDSI
ncbi:MAG: hypothetical protein ABIM18_08510 [candidate division WOR-3 bacterium]